MDRKLVNFAQPIELVRHQYDRDANVLTRFASTQVDAVRKMQSPNLRQWGQSQQLLVSWYLPITKYSFLRHFLRQLHESYNA